jgi:hypothetical protein
MQYWISQAGNIETLQSKIVQQSWGDHHTVLHHNLGINTMKNMANMYFYHLKLIIVKLVYNAITRGPVAGASS